MNLCPVGSDLKPEFKLRLDEGLIHMLNIVTISQISNKAVYRLTFLVDKLSKQKKNIHDAIRARQGRRQEPFLV